MKKYSTILPILNIIIVAIFLTGDIYLKYYPGWNVGSLFIMYLLFLVCGGLLIAGMMASGLEKQHELSIKVLLVKIIINFIFSFICASFSFWFWIQTMPHITVKTIVKVGLALALENIFGYSIVLIIKYIEQRKTNKF